MARSALLALVLSCWLLTAKADTRQVIELFVPPTAYWTIIPADQSPDGIRYVCVGNQGDLQLLCAPADKLLAIGQPV